MSVNGMPNVKSLTLKSVNEFQSLKMSDEFQYLPQDRSFATRAIHGGYSPSASTQYSIAPPLIMSTTFKQNGPAQPYDYEYARSGNPSRDILQNTLAKMDNAKYGLCFASGLGALSVVISTLKAGDHVLCIDDVYGGTGRFLRNVASRNNITTTFCDFENVDNIKDKINDNTKAVWIETPTNPLLKVVDIAYVSNSIKAIRKDIVVIVDNTFLTSYFQKPLDFGADLVVYSITKYLNGHADVVMGAVVLNDQKLYEELKYLQNSMGQVPSPFDCYLVTRSLKTLKVRMEEHMASATTIAKYLENHPAVEKVLYPGLPSHPNYSLSLKQCTGCSGMLSFYLKGGLEESTKFLKCLKYFQTAESLGGYESLVEIPSIMTHSSVPEDVRAQLGITDNLIRVSVGLESIDDLIADLNTGLDLVLKN